MRLGSLQQAGRAQPLAFCFMQLHVHISWLVNMYKYMYQGECIHKTTYMYVSNRALFGKNKKGPGLSICVPRDIYAEQDR